MSIVKSVRAVRGRHVTATLVCAGLAGTAAAAEFRSIADRPAVVYDAPSQKANRTAILGPSSPVELLVKLDKWTKVRDFSGEAPGWVESALLSEVRRVVVSVPRAEIRAQPNASAPLVFEALKQVLLEETGPASEGWIPVRHRDGQQGFVKAAQVWGE